MDNTDKDRVIDAALIESNDTVQPSAPYSANTPVSTIEKDTKHWAALLHLSTLLGFISFGVGLIAPIVIWQWKKDELPGIDAHGKVVANAIVSYLIYALIFGFFSVFLIGIPFLMLTFLLAAIYPVIAALKARDGEVWPYPLCFKFF